MAPVALEDCLGASEGRLVGADAVVELVLEAVFGLGVVFGPEVGGGVAAAELERDAVVDFPVWEGVWTS